MDNKPQDQAPPRRRWPWFVLAAVILGTVLFIVWLWFAIEKVKRIKASTHGAVERVMRDA